MALQMASVSFLNAVKIYPSGVRAVDSLTLKIADGEFFVLLGPSGSGKSTVLRMIAGLEELTEGGLFIGGRDARRIRPADRRIAMVFQTPALLPHMTVYGNLALGLKAKGGADKIKLPIDEIDKRVRGAAETLGISELLDRKPAELSGGQQQRVALGRAIVTHPQVFLFDEPLNSLDGPLKAAMRAELTRLFRTFKVPFIYVTHDQPEAMSLATRIAVLKGGRLCQVGTPQDLIDRPADKFVAGFIGEPPMNFFEARLSCDGACVNGGIKAVFAGGGSMPLDCSTVIPGEYSAGKPLIIGARPKNVFLRAPVADNKGLFRGVVTHTEQLAGETVVYFQLNGEQRLYSAISDKNNDCIFKADDTVDVSLCAKHLYFFDAETEKNISV